MFPIGPPALLMCSQSVLPRSAAWLLLSKREESRVTAPRERVLVSRTSDLVPLCGPRELRLQMELDCKQLI